MNDQALYKILVVDDNRNNLLTIRELIKQHINAVVIEADSGEKALQLLYEQLVDLIILDIHMDKMDGFELASLIKKRKRTKEIPIVFLTAAYISEEFKKRGFEIGAVDYLTKPIDEFLLINRINVYLKLIEKERTLNAVLERKVKEQTQELIKQTEELKLQAVELIKAKEEATASSEAKSMFLANISHELRTPLNILLSSTQLINLYLDKEAVLEKDKVREKMQIQAQNCYRMLRLVNNLIDITKIDTDNFSLIFNSYDIVRIIRMITLSVKEYVEDKGIQIYFNTNIQEKFLWCDADAVERILLNLISNAIKFTPKNGQISVDIVFKKRSLNISVKDTGIGIKEDMIKVVFEKFKQADNLLTRKNEGSGIGLSLCKSLVEMHGGSISVISEYQYGSEFIIEFPINEGVDGKINNNYDTEVIMDNERIIKKINVEFSDIYF